MIVTIFISIFGLILGQNVGAYDEQDCSSQEVSPDREIRITKANEKCKIRYFWYHYLPQNESAVDICFV